MKSDPSNFGLPHRKPFLFVDRILSLVPGEEAVGEKTFESADPMFSGHFPGNPIVPGVILTEALAQVAGIAGARGGEQRFLLSAIRSMKFPAAARPGDLISLRAKTAGAFGQLVQSEVVASVGEVVVATGMLVLNDTSNKNQ